MTPAPRLEREAVLASLTVSAVLAHFGIEGKVRGCEIRFALCPACGGRSRPDTVGMNVDTGQWRDYAHGCKGDLLAFVALAAGLDIKRSFPEVLALAADIAGVSPGVDHRALVRMAEEREVRDRELAKARAKTRLIASHAAAGIWREASERSRRGEDYLAGRGLDPAALIERGAVRFLDGDPVVALWSSAGNVINVVRRRVAGEPKVRGLKDCATAGTLVGRISTILPGRAVVITEGVADSLAAVLAWPDAVVLGAHGASNLDVIGLVLSKLAPQSLVTIVPHRDAPNPQHPLGVGLECATKAACWMINAKMPTTMIDLAPHKDLADAWAAGWRP